MRDFRTPTRWVLLGLGVLAWAGALACTGATRGGDATPSGGTSTPIAVEIPALGEVSGLPFASGTVISESGSVSAPLKSLRKSGFILSKPVATPSKPVATTDKPVATTSKPDTPADTSFHACKTLNSIGLMQEAMMRSDVSTCILQAVAKQAEAAGVDIYGGSDVIYSVDTGPDTPSKFKVNITRGSDNRILQSTLYGCNSVESRNVQYQRYRITGNDVAIHTWGHDPVAKLQRSIADVKGTVSSRDPTQFVNKKEGFFRFSAGDSIDGGVLVQNDSLIGGASDGTGTLVQKPDTVVVNTLFVPGGNQHLVASSDFSNSTSGKSFDPRANVMGAGAATFTQYDAATTGCWEDARNPVACLESDGNYVAMSGEAATVPDIQQDAYAFDLSEMWDCEGENSLTVSNYASAVNDCIERFSSKWSEANCSALEPNTAWLVQASNSTGVSLSTTEDSFTDITSSLGQLYISSNQPVNTDTFNDTTIQLQDLTTNTPVELYAETWNSAKTEMFALYGYSNHNYKLTIAGGADGIRSADGKTLSDGKTYYFMINGGYHQGWSVSSITPSGGNAIPSVTPFALDGMTTNVSTATSSYAITFSEAMDAATITTDTVALSCNASGNVPGTIVAAPSPANTYVFKTDTALSPLDLCAISVMGEKDGVKDSDGDTSSTGYGAGFQTGCTTNDNFAAYSQSLPVSACWKEANITYPTTTPDYLYLIKSDSATGADAPRESKTFGSADITTTIEITSANGLSDLGDRCGMRLMNPSSDITGAIISLKADGNGGIVIEKSTAAGDNATAATIVSSGSSFGGRTATVYLRLTQSGGSTAASYRLGNSGDFTPLGSALTVSFGATKRLDLFVTSDGNGTVDCSLDNFTAAGASADGQD